MRTEYNHKSILGFVHAGINIGGAVTVGTLAFATQANPLFYLLSLAFLTTGGLYLAGGIMENREQSSGNKNSPKPKKP